MCSDLKGAGIVGVIVQAITGLDGNSYTRQQLDACQRNGLRVQGYVWCFPGAAGNPVSMRSRLAMFDGFSIEDLWLDVEQAGLDRADVDADLALCDAYLGRAAGIYSAHWFFASQGWLGVNWWASRRLWEALYDNNRNVTAGFVPYGGWTGPTIKQFWGTSTIGHVHQIDQDIEQG